MEDVQSFRLSNCKIDIAIKCRVTRRRVPCCHTAPPGSASGIILPINSWNCFHGFHGSSIDVQELWSKSLGWPSRRDCFYASPWASLACLVLPDTNTITLVDVITHLAFPCPSVITGFRTARSAAVFSSLIPFFFLFCKSGSSYSMLIPLFKEAVKAGKTGVWRYAHTNSSRYRQTRSTGFPRDIPSINYPSSSYPHFWLLEAPESWRKG